MGNPFNYIIKKASGLYYCMICNCNMPSKKSVEDHLNGHRHENSLEQHGCHMKFERDNHQYFCECCSCKIYGWINVYPHLRGKRHTVLVNKVDESLANCKGLPCDFLVRKSDNSYSCSLCNCKMSGRQSANQHIYGNRHAMFMLRYGYDIALIKNNHHYYCRICKCQFLGYYHIWAHIHGRRHKSLMNEE